jgi:hypothetical protein
MPLPTCLIVSTGRTLGHGLSVPIFDGQVVQRPISPWGPWRDNWLAAVLTAEAKAVGLDTRVKFKHLGATWGGQQEPERVGGPPLGEPKSPRIVDPMSLFTFECNQEEPEDQEGDPTPWDEGEADLSAEELAERYSGGRSVVYGEQAEDDLTAEAMEAQYAQEQVDDEDVELREWVAQQQAQQEDDGEMNENDYARQEWPQPEEEEAWAAK